MPGAEDRVAQPFQSSPEAATAGMAFWEAAGDAFSTFFFRNTAMSPAQPADCSACSRAELSGRVFSGACLISGTGRDGTGRFRKMRVPNFRDDGTITEILTCLNPGIT